MPEYYQPISAVDDDGGSSDGENGVEIRHLPNGYVGHGGVENGVASLNLNDGAEQKSSDEEEEEEEEDRRMREEFEREVRRTLGEDESRRNAPLSEENASRVMEAMRGVNFLGLPPDWASQISEENWIERLRRLRQSPNT